MRCLGYWLSVLCLSIGLVGCGGGGISEGIPPTAEELRAEEEEQDRLDAADMAADEEAP